MKYSKYIISIVLCVILLLSSITGCRTKKTITNKKIDIINTIQTEFNDTTDENEDITITITKIDSNTIKKEIKKKSKKVQRGTGKNKQDYHRTDSQESKNTTSDAKKKQQIKDLKKENKTLKKIATKGEGKWQNLLNRLVICGLIIIFLSFIYKKKWF